MYVFNRITVNPQLPKRIEKLSVIANNLWWSWNTEFLKLFRKIDNDLWEKCGKNPIKFLREVSQDRLEAVAKDLIFLHEYDKNVENGSKWHIIVINDSKKIYGTGWTYIPRGSTISDTKTNETWLINNSSQEIIKLEDGTFTDLSYKTAVGTTDGLILNLDPSVIENATKENINEKGLQRVLKKAA